MSSLPYTFQNKALLETALTVPAANRRGPDYQRLEFLGDAVLELLVSERLFEAFPEALEGELTERRTQLVSGRSLLRRAARLGIAELLAEQNRGVTWPEKAQVDVVEALLGAAWMDGGRVAAEAFFAVLFSEEDFGAEALSPAEENPKGRLQQLGQRTFGCEPVYALVACAGPSHAPEFCCSATLAGHSATGKGPTRKAAEAEAAQHLLTELSEL